MAWAAGEDEDEDEADEADVVQVDGGEKVSRYELVARS